MEPNSQNGLILLSGGVDSCVMLAQALFLHRTCRALSFDYGQRHRIELSRATAIARQYGVPHQILRIDPQLFSERTPVTTGPAAPSTYVPCRNLLFLAHAASYAESVQASEIWIGANADDVPTYPDCAPSFFQAFEAAATMGSYIGANGLKIVSPLSHLSKRAVISLGRELRAPLHLTWSCYDPQGDQPCAVCPACLLRQKSGC